MIVSSDLDNGKLRRDTVVPWKQFKSEKCFIQDD